VVERKNVVLLGLAGCVATLPPALVFLLLSLPFGFGIQDVSYFVAGATIAVGALLGFESVWISWLLVPVALAIPFLAMSRVSARRARLGMACCVALGCINGAVGFLVTLGRLV
jgi:hypothetical protein